MTLSLRLPRDSFFWRLAAFFLVLLLALTAVLGWVGLRVARQYSMEVNQQVGRGIASHTVQEIKPFVDGVLDESAAHDIMHAMMIINPDVEVYLLSPEGEILTYVAPYKEVKLEKVGLAPIRNYLQSEPDQGLILGDDPREPGRQNIFSAAPVMEGDAILGYVYIILAGQAYASTAEALMGSYVLRSGRDAILLLLGLSILLSFLGVWLLTRNLQRIAAGIKRFRDGDLQTRLALQSGGEFKQVADGFDDMAATIEQNVEKLRSVERLRRELVANISHDLRTPISAISGYAETLLLQDAQLTTDKRQEYLNTIVRGSRRLDKLVSDLFSLSKLEAQQVQWQPEPVQLADLVQDIAAQYRLIAREKGISIHTLISSQPPMVQADIALLDRVFQNILDNAIRHCQDGDSVSLEIHPGHGTVRIRIADTGEGISPEDLPHVFDRFHRARKDGSGSGLGLAIVKRIVALHKSEVHVESTLDEGTAFWFDLPAA